MDGKLVIADRGYQSSKKDGKMLSPPSLLDPPELYNFKFRACLCHEVLNGRMWNFKSISDTWRHGAKK
eukprot:12789639-Ditylum_brightwellii.AAC.1